MRPLELEDSCWGLNVRIKIKEHSRHRGHSGDEVVSMWGGGPRHTQVPDSYAVVRSRGVRGKDVLTQSLDPEGGTETCDLSCPGGGWMQKVNVDWPNHSAGLAPAIKRGRNSADLGEVIGSLIALNPRVRGGPEPLDSGNAHI